METIRKSIRIGAPAERVYEHLGVPENLVEIWPSLVEVANVQRGTGPAERFEWTYKMAGMRFHGHSRLVESRPGRLLVTRSEQGIPSTFRWTFEPRGDETEVAVEVEYELPIPLLGRLAAPFLRRLNERELEGMVANLKERLETGTDAVRPAPRAEPPQPHA